jgi:sugar lactone lactonase YvrE
LWWVDTGQRLWEIDLGLHSFPPYAVAFSPDGKSVLIGAPIGAPRLLLADTGEPSGAIFRFDPNLPPLPTSLPTSLTAVAFSPDGKFVLTGSDDRTARLWRVDSGQLISTLRHEDSVRALAFSPDGKFVLTGSDDRTARLWRSDSGQLISTLRLNSFVLAVAFSPDGKNAAAMTNNWIHFSSMTEGGLIHRASRRVPGPWRADGFHFDSSDGLRLRIAWLHTGDSISIDTLRFDTPDAPPIAGDPKELLNDWMKRLALKFDERWKIVPSQPVETTPARNGMGPGKSI